MVIRVLEVTVYALAFYVAVGAWLSAYPIGGKHD